MYWLRWQISMPFFWLWLKVMPRCTLRDYVISGLVDGANDWRADYDPERTTHD